MGERGEIAVVDDAEDGGDVLVIRVVRSRRFRLRKVAILSTVNYAVDDY